MVSFPLQTERAESPFFMLVVIGIILPHVVLGLVIVIILVLMSMLTMAVVV